MEERDPNRLPECITNSRHKVSRRQWEAVKEAIKKVEETRIPSDVEKLQQCRDRRSIQNFFLKSLAIEDTTISPELQSIINNSLCNAGNDIDVEETLKQSSTSFINNIERFISPTDEDSSLALPSLFLEESEMKKLVDVEISKLDQRTSDDDEDGSNSCDDSLSEYDSDEADAQFLDKKALERVAERRRKAYIAEQAMAERRKALILKVKNILLLERQMLENSPTHSFDSNDACFDNGFDAIRSQENFDSRENIAKPKKLFATVGHDNDELSSTGADDIKTDELEQKLANLKSSLVKGKKLLVAAERDVPKALKNSKDTVEVVRAYIQKMKSSDGPSNSIDEALLSVEKKRSKKAEQQPTLKRSKGVTPEARFLAYLQKV